MGQDGQLELKSDLSRYQCQYKYLRESIDDADLSEDIESAIKGIVSEKIRDSIFEQLESEQWQTVRLRPFVIEDDGKYVTFTRQYQIAPGNIVNRVIIKYRTVERWFFLRFNRKMYLEIVGFWRWLKTQMKRISNENGLIDPWSKQ